jgi:hypothetical protein
VNAPEKYRQWSKQYGPVFQIMLGNEPVVVVNSAKAAHETFLSQGNAMSSRPMFYTFHKVFPALCPLFFCSANDRYCHPLPALQLALLQLPSLSNVDERPRPVPSIDRAFNRTPPSSISRPPISSKISGNVEVEAPAQSIVCQ